MPGIFISYRRDDSAGHTGRIYDRLATQFGPAQVFMDVDAIQPGEDFTRVLAERTKSCSALVAIIGRQWLSARIVTDIAGWTIPATTCALKSCPL